MKTPKTLKPILYDEKLSAFNLSNKLDIFDTTLVLDDYDWMNYTLSSRMPTKAYGDIRIEFEYFGFGVSNMRVETKKKTYVYQFQDTKLFKEHIVKFLQKHMQHWKDIYAFRSIEEVVNFYNAVLASPNTVLQNTSRRNTQEPTKEQKAAWKKRIS